MPSTEILVQRQALARIAAIEALEEASPGNERVQRLASYRDANLVGGGDVDVTDCELVAALAEAVRDLASRAQPESKKSQSKSKAAKKKS